LVEVETRIEEQAAGATTEQAKTKGAIVTFAWKLQREGYSESTIKTYVDAMKILVRKGADIFNPTSVKDIVARQRSWNNTSKFNYVNFYDAFARIMEISWQKPRYRPVEKLPFICQERHIDQLVYSAGKKMGTVLLVIKETALRIGEVLGLLWENIDSENNRIILNNPEKRGRSRIFKVSEELISRLWALPRKSEKVFGNSNRHNYEAAFLRLRKRLTAQQKNPVFKRITFHSIRHWKATMLYHQTKDILYVMKFLGHRNIKNTLVYTQLVEFTSEKDFYVKTAKTVEEACELAKSGFTHFTTIEGIQVFRKPK